MPRRPPEIPPTFPIPPAELARRRRALMLNSPLLWSLALTALAAATLLRHPLAIAVVTATCFLSLICMAFRLKPANVERAVLKDWIKSSNARQDRELASYASLLHEQGFITHAKIVIEFLEKKRRIETVLEQPDTVTPARMEVENLVDRICLAIPTQVEQLLETERRLADNPAPPPDDATRRMLENTRATLSNRIERAREILARTEADLGTVFDPTAECRLIEEGEDLEQTIDKLEQELEISRRTRTRILGDGNQWHPGETDIVPDQERATDSERDRTSASTDSETPI